MVCAPRHKSEKANKIAHDAADKDLSPVCSP
jgi:hypothetical protein